MDKNKLYWINHYKLKKVLQFLAFAIIFILIMLIAGINEPI